MSKYKNFFNQILITNDDLINEISFLNDSLQHDSYNIADQNGYQRDKEDIKIKVAISNLLERYIANFIAKELKTEVFLNQFCCYGNKPEIADFSFNFNNITLTGEIRTSDIQPLVRQLKCSLIGTYKNHIKQQEPDKDIYIQVFWNQNFDFIKSNIKEKKQSILTFNLAAFAFKNNFFNNDNLGQSNTNYNIIKPITLAFPFNTFRINIESYSQQKINDMELKLNFRLNNIIENIKLCNLKDCLFLEDFNTKKHFFRIYTKNDLTFDVPLNIIPENNQTLKSGILFYFVSNNSFKTRFNFINPINGQEEKGFLKFLNIISNINYQDIKFDFCQNNNFLKTQNKNKNKI